DEEAAPSAIDIDLRQLENRALEEYGQPFTCAERRSAADLIARVALRDIGLAGLDALEPRLAGQVLGRYLAIAVHQHDEWLAVLVLHHQRLHYLVLGYA